MSENNRPQGWGKDHKLPDNWGKQSSGLESKTLSGGVSMSSSEPDKKSDIKAEDKVSFSDKARSGAGKLAGIAKKVGGTAKNAAGNAVEYAKSDEAKEKLNAVKSKAKSIADGAGSAFTDLKEKTGDAINERRSSKVESALSDNDISDNAIDDKFAPDTYEETSSDIVQTENSYDDSIDVSDLNPALDSESGEPSDTLENAGLSADRQDIPDTSTEDGEYAVTGNRKSNGKWIAIIAIVIVALACVIGGIIFMQKNREKTGDISSNVKNESSNESSEDDTEETEGSTSTVAASTTAVISSTTSIVTSSESKTDIKYPEYSSKEISAMFSAYVAENPDPNRNYENADYGYALIDLNNDGVQELLITQDEVEAGSPGVIGIFNINNNSLDSIWISDFRTLGRLCENNCIYTSDIYGQGYGIFIYKYSSGGSLEEVESIEYNASIGREKALQNGREVSQSEAEEILAKYNAKNFKTKQLKFEEKTPEVTEPNTSTLKNTELGRMYNAFYIESISGGKGGGYIEDYNSDGIDDLICSVPNAGYAVFYYKNGDIECNVIPNTDNYGYDEPLFGMKTQYYAWDVLPDKCREKAISCGFTVNKDFYKGSTYFIGYVKTTDIDGTLNLRSAPSTDSDVLVQLPNGKLFNVIPESTGNYGVYDNNGWYYISVNQNGNNYMGYISSDYAVAWDNGI